MRGMGKSRAVLLDRVGPDVDAPDGFMVQHHRAYDTLNFGPFADGAAVRAWLAEHPDVRGAVVPLYLDVDWARRPGVAGSI